VVVIVAAVVFFLVAVNALYVAAEFATVSARRTRVEELAESGNRLAAALLPILKDPAQLDRYIAACQIGITLSSLIVGFFSQARLTPVIAPWLSGNFGLSPLAAVSITSSVVLVLLTALQVVFGELVPKSISLRYPERVALGTMLPMRWSLFLLRPFIAVLNGSALALMRRLGLRNTGEHAHVHSPEELEFLFRESARGGYIDAGEREMLENVLHIRTRTARQIMVPRTRMVTASGTATPRQLLRELVASPHTRFPVIGETSDEILGMVHLRELFAFAQDHPEGALTAVVRALPLLPESISVSELWAELRQQRAHMAVLFDEYGGVAGLVTLEDIIEEVVGELQDEFDQEVEAVRELGGGRVRLRGDLLVRTVNSRFLLDLPTDTDTIGGLVMEKLEHTPRVGERLELAGARFEVGAVHEGAVTDVLLTMPQPREDEAAA
jgi:putative hemolysin